MTEGQGPVWLRRETVLAVHGEQVAEHGGAAGARVEGLPDSALARPRNHFACTGADVPELAAMHALAIARNHPFIDGNKRTAYVALEPFLIINGCGFLASDCGGGPDHARHGRRRRGRRQFHRLGSPPRRAFAPVTKRPVSRHMVPGVT